jgi:hypothetical protein
MKEKWYRANSCELNLIHLYSSLVKRDLSVFFGRAQKAFLKKKGSLDIVSQ